MLSAPPPIRPESLWLPPTYTVQLPLPAAENRAATPDPTPPTPPTPRTPRTLR